MASTLSTPRFALAGRSARRAGRARVAVVRASMDRERSGGEGERERERSADQTARSDIAPGGMSPGREWLMKQPGIGPIPGFFDPWGFTAKPTFSVSAGKRFREAEVTHGRVAMLATVGWLVQEKWAPLFGGQIGGPALRHFQEVQAVWPSFWIFVTIAIAVAESNRAARGWNVRPIDGPQADRIKDSYYPGALGFDPLGLAPREERELKIMATKELNNGRLAMIAIAGFAAQEEVNHLTIWQEMGRRGWPIPGAEAVVKAASVNLP